GLILAGVAGPASLAGAQPDPEGRLNLELGLEAAAKGNAPVSLYAFLLWTRPQYPAEHFYSRLVLAPTYLEGELVRDQVFGWTGHAVGFGLSGGLFPYGFRALPGRALPPPPLLLRERGRLPPGLLPPRGARGLAPPPGPAPARGDLRGLRQGRGHRLRVPAPPGDPALL